MLYKSSPSVSLKSLFFVLFVLFFTPQDSSITESPAKKGRSSRTHDVKAWIGVCTRLLDIIFDMEDSVPFRQPKGYSIDSVGNGKVMERYIIL